MRYQLTNKNIRFLILAILAGFIFLVLNLALAADAQQQLPPNVYKTSTGECKGHDQFRGDINTGDVCVTDPNYKEIPFNPDQLPKAYQDG